MSLPCRSDGPKWFSGHADTMGGIVAVNDEKLAKVLAKSLSPVT